MRRGKFTECHITINLPSEKVDILKKQADELGLSLSSYLRMIVFRWLNEKRGDE